MNVAGQHAALAFLAWAVLSSTAVAVRSDAPSYRVEAVAFTPLEQAFAYEVAAHQPHIPYCTAHDDFWNAARFYFIAYESNRGVVALGGLMRMLAALGEPDLAQQIKPYIENLPPRETAPVAVEMPAQLVDNVRAAIEAHRICTPPTTATPAPTSAPTLVPTAPATQTLAPTQAPTPIPTTPLQTSIPTPVQTPTPAPTPTPVPAPALAAVPPVVGLAEYDAVVDIESSRLRAIRRDDKPGCGEPGRVTRTYPSAGTRVATGSEVRYWIAPDRYLAPPVRGLSPDDARALLKSTCLRVGAIEYQPALSVAGQVLRQDPPAGTALPVDYPVTLTVASGGGLFAAILVIGSMAVVGVVAWRVNRRRLVRKTLRLLKVDATLVDGPASLPDGLRIAGPVAHVEAVLEQGSVSFEGDARITEPEVRND